MGTNYYAEIKPSCPHCGAEPVTKHIGKNSVGWCFSLHVYPEEGINNLKDWIKILEGKIIRNEYGDNISAQELIDIISNKRGKVGSDPPPIKSFVTGNKYASWEDFYRDNGAELSPYGLMWPIIDNCHCVGHGEDGAYALIIGDFS